MRRGSIASRVRAVLRGAEGSAPPDPFPHHREQGRGGRPGQGGVHQGVRAWDRVGSDGGSGGVPAPDRHEPVPQPVPAGRVALGRAVGVGPEQDVFKPVEDREPRPGPSARSRRGSARPSCYRDPGVLGRGGRAAARDQGVDRLGAHPPGPNGVAGNRGGDRWLATVPSWSARWTGSNSPVHAGRIPPASPAQGSEPPDRERRGRPAGGRRDDRRAAPGHLLGHDRRRRRSAPFLGRWVATDADGSIQHMTVRSRGDEAVEIVVHDDSAAVCSGVPSTMTGAGAVVGTDLVSPRRCSRATTERAEPRRLLPSRSSSAT